MTMICMMRLYMNSAVEEINICIYYIMIFVLLCILLCAVQGKNCYYNATYTCPINTLPYGKVSYIYPQRNTRCIYTNNPYYFQVIPRNKKNVIVYFQEGGFCISNGNTCRTSVAPIQLNGIFSNDTRNAYRFHTIIVVSYCSGDQHFGNAVGSFLDPRNRLVEHRGLVNTQAVLDWLLQQQEMNYIHNPLYSLVIMGSSSGAVGVVIHGDYFLNKTNHIYSLLLFDSGLPIASPANITNIGFCFSHLLTPFPHVKNMCLRGELFLHTYYNRVSRYYNPSLPRLWIFSKNDSRFTETLTKQLMNKLNNTKNIGFYVNSKRHGYLFNNILFDTSPIGNYKNISQYNMQYNTQFPMLHNWIYPYPVNTPIFSQCVNDSRNQWWKPECPRSLYPLQYSPLV